MEWSKIATINLTNEWQTTILTNATLFKVVHVSVDNIPVTAIVGQSIDDPFFVFDARDFKPLDIEKGFLFERPDGLKNRRLAFRRVDTQPQPWTIDVYENVTTMTEFVPSIDSIPGLRTALEETSLSASNWQPLNLVDSWYNDDSNDYAPATCRKVTPNLIEVQGYIRRPGGIGNSIVAIIPEGYRPTKNFYTVLINTGSTFKCEIRSNGEIYVTGAHKTSIWLHFMFGI